MNLNNFTIKAQEAIQQAQQLAFNAQNPNIETEHILKALLDQEDSPVEYLLKEKQCYDQPRRSKLDEMLEITQNSREKLDNRLAVMQIR